MKKNKDVCSMSVVIPVYNDFDILKTCIERLRPQMISQGIVYEVIVVDDFSTQDIKKELEKTFGRELNLRIIRLKENMGRFKARLEGAKNARYDDLLVMDVRAWLPKHFIKKMVGVGYQPLQARIKAIDADNMVNRSMELLRERIYLKTYEVLDSGRSIMLNEENFELFGKGTTLIYIKKQMYLKACKDSIYQDKHSHEEGWLLKNIIRQKPIKVCGELVVEYNHRSDILSECEHFFQRGPRFIQYYMRPGTRYFPYLLVLMLGVWIYLFSFSLVPDAADGLTLIFTISYLLFIVKISKKTSDIPKLILVLTPVGISFFIGLIYGIIISILKGKN